MPSVYPGGRCRANFSARVPGRVPTRLMFVFAERSGRFFTNKTKSKTIQTLVTHAAPASTVRAPPVRIPARAPRTRATLLETSGRASKGPCCLRVVVIRAVRARASHVVHVARGPGAREFSVKNACSAATACPPSPPPPPRPVSVPTRHLTRNLPDPRPCTVYGKRPDRTKNRFLLIRRSR